MSFGSTTPTDPLDAELLDPPTDSISSLAFSTAANSQNHFLAVGSWDNNVRLYEVSPAGQSQGKAMYSHQGPVLDVCWNGQEGTKVFSGGTDNAGRMHDVATGQSSQVAQHDAPIKSVKWVEIPHGGGLLATGSWDKTIKYWDIRSQAPVTSVQLPERCYSFDVRYPYLVVAGADRFIQTYNLNNPSVVYKNVPSPLKWQTRVVRCFSNGYAMGGIEGRLAVQYFEDKDSTGNFSWRCHRQPQAPGEKELPLVHAINDISFHPTHGTLSTCGSDGALVFWDKDARNRLKSFDNAPAPIVASSFSRDGNIFAYGISYDWHKGHTGMTPGMTNKVLLKAIKDADVAKKVRR